MSRGSLRICVGPMFSGKTTWLNGELTELADFGLNCLKIVHEADKQRDPLVPPVEIEGIASGSTGSTGASELKTSGFSHSSSYKMLSSKIDVRFTDKLTNLQDLSEYSIIGIDEGQFFPDLVEFVQFCLAKDKHILVAGLDGDFQQRKFGLILDLIPMCDEVQKKLSRCKLCLSENINHHNPMILKAPFSAKINGNGTAAGVIDIGGEDKYMPVCRYHHNTER